MSKLFVGSLAWGTDDRTLYVHTFLPTHLLWSANCFIVSKLISMDSTFVRARVCAVYFCVLERLHSHALEIWWSAKS
jgi:hypothetical protein